MQIDESPLGGVTRVTPIPDKYLHNLYNPCFLCNPIMLSKQRLIAAEKLSYGIRISVRVR